MLKNMLKMHSLTNTNSSPPKNAIIATTPEPTGFKSTA